MLWECSQDIEWSTAIQWLTVNNFNILDLYKEDVYSNLCEFRDVKNFLTSNDRPIKKPAD